jgi:Predicted membrane protein
MTSSWWVYALGFTAQGLFSARVLVQWLLSEKKRKVVSPSLFWILSLIASVIYVIYGWLRQDFAIMLGQVIGYYVYIWNLWAKQVWQKLGRVGSRMAVTAFILLPVVAISAMLITRGSAVTDSLFKNEGLPLWLLLFGTTGTLIFSLRFLYQFIYSSRRGESILPKGFWIISLTGSLIVVTYAIIRRDPVLILGQGLGLISYTRNLMIWNRTHSKG